MNLQLMVTSLLIAGIVITNCERERHLSEKVEDYETQISMLTASYQQRLLEQQKEYEALQAQSMARLSELSDLRSYTDRLRSELEAANARAAALPHTQDRSEPAAVDLSGRLKAMGKALDRATAIIAERDQCAINYNALRAQCQGGKDGSFTTDPTAQKK